MIEHTSIPDYQWQLFLFPLQEHLVLSMCVLMPLEFFTIECLELFFDHQCSSLIPILLVNFF